MPPLPRVTFCDFGEDAVLIDLGVEDAPDRASRTHAAARALGARLSGADIVVGAGTLLVEGASRPALEAALAELADVAKSPPDHAESPAPTRAHTIHVVYDGPDLEEASQALGISTSELIDRHTGRDHLVELLGFLPGFAYLGPLDPGLVLARRAAPRPLVPAGSVGIAGSFTGVYPFTSPGGWHLIGRAVGVVLFDPERDPPSLFQPGDRVRFVAYYEGEGATEPVAKSASVAKAPSPTAKGLVVVQTQIGATVQDMGRPGQLSRGLPPSGPLDPEALTAANIAVGNPEGAAAIEIPLGSLEIEAKGQLVLSIDGAPSVTLEDGERLRVEASESAVRYLAVRGGVDVPVVLGARATLLAARLGGLYGRALRRGDFVPVPNEAPSTPVTERLDAPPRAQDELIEIDPGPHLARFPEGALDALTRTSFQVSWLGDRVGLRLEGGRIPRDRPDLALPVPMRRGAIQITTDGTPIVLGPDHPITGGYPVLAIVRRASLGKLARRRPGQSVRFRLCSDVTSLVDAAARGVI